MAEIIDNGMHYASNAKGNAALATGIIGTSLACLMALGGFGNGQNGGGLFGNLFGGCNANKNYTMTEEELYLERKQAQDNIDITKQYYQGIIDFNKNLTDGFFAAYERDVKNSFDLYKLSRDQKDELTKRIDDVDKKVDIMAAIRPYQDALINSKIDNVAMVADFNLARRTCRMISGEVVLPSTPTVTGYASYSPCQCSVQQAPTT